MGPLTFRRCGRRIDFDAAHRVMRHESKCQNLHGHRYIADVQVSAPVLDPLGRVVDFAVIKQTVGGWIDEHWDHGCIVNGDDAEVIALCERAGWKLYKLAPGINPTAENMAERLYRQAGALLEPSGLSVVSVRLYETPTCWAVFP